MEKFDMKSKKSKGLLGFEPWVVENVVVDTRIKNDFVRVLNARKADITLPNPADRSEKVIYNFDILVNKSRLHSNDFSGMRLISMYIYIAGIKSDDDLKRAVRKFEISANTFNNSTKAKKPNYIVAFSKIDMNYYAWKNMFPKL